MRTVVYNRTGRRRYVDDVTSFLRGNVDVDGRRRRRRRRRRNVADDVDDAMLK
jgi:hypothetical protein